jgi:hypothetical protein
VTDDEAFKMHEPAKDLLGSADGTEEILDDRSVREPYILGLLRPRGQNARPLPRPTHSQPLAAACGWDDLDLGHGFHETPQGTRFTLSEAARREVLARLLRLNHERYEEEVRAGLHEKKKAGGGKQKAEGEGAGGKKRARKKSGGEGGEQLGMI